MKYAVKVAFPDITIIPHINMNATFAIEAESAIRAAEKGRRMGEAIVTDMLIHRRVEPYTIDLIAQELVDLIWVREWGKY